MIFHIFFIFNENMLQYSRKKILLCYWNRSHDKQEILLRVLQNLISQLFDYFEVEVFLSIKFWKWLLLVILHEVKSSVTCMNFRKIWEYKRNCYRTWGELLENSCVSRCEPLKLNDKYKLQTHKFIKFDG